MSSELIITKNKTKNYKFRFVNEVSACLVMSIQDVWVSKSITVESCNQISIRSNPVFVTVYGWDARSIGNMMCYH